MNSIIGTEKHLVATRHEIVGIATVYVKANVFDKRRATRG